MCIRDSVTTPAPGPSDVVVRVSHSWISNGTEGSFLRGERIEGDTPYSSAQDPWPFPIVAGYQKIGVVEWVGQDIDDLASGETVFATMGKVKGMYRERVVSLDGFARQPLEEIVANADLFADQQRDPIRDKYREILAEI